MRIKNNKYRFGNYKKIIVGEESIIKCDGVYNLNKTATYLLNNIERNESLSIEDLVNLICNHYSLATYDIHSVICDVEEIINVFINVGILIKDEVYEENCQLD